MPVGPAVRHALGPLESRAANLYRSFFVDLHDFARSLGPHAGVERLLEIGCGDGMLTAELAAVFPAATLLGIDVVPEPGRLFVDADERVEFRQQTAQDLLAAGGEPFDLVVLGDVLHHVPVGERVELVRTSRDLTRPGGLLVVKEWERRGNLAHLAAAAADRYITGDRGVAFLDRTELRDLLAAACPGDPIVGEFRVPPRRNNLVLVVAHRGEGTV